AFLLPALEAPASRSDRAILPRPTRIDLLGFTVGFGVDGIFVMTLALLLHGVVSMESAVIAGGLMIATRRLMEIVTAPIGGVLGDRFGANRMVLLFGIALSAGMAAIASGAPMLGAGAIVVAHGALVTLQPVLVAQRHPEGTMSRLAVFSAWRGIGRS